MIIRLISCFKHPGRSRRERSELFAEIIGNHLVLESPGRSRAERRGLIRNIMKYIEIQGCALIRFFTKPFPTVPFFYETFCTKPSLNETFCTKPPRTKVLVGNHLGTTLLVRNPPRTKPIKDLPVCPGEEPF